LRIWLDPSATSDAPPPQADNLGVCRLFPSDGLLFHNPVKKGLPTIRQVSRQIIKQRLFSQDVSALMRPNDHCFSFTRHAKDIAMRALTGVTRNLQPLHTVSR
jgi:hypothetical protein